MCTFHHHLVHEGGWSVARGENGELAFTAPDGRALPAEPPRQMVNDVLESLYEWAADRGLDLGPDSNLPLWDGTRPDYDWAVGRCSGQGRSGRRQPPRQYRHVPSTLAVLLNMCQAPPSRSFVVQASLRKPDDSPESDDLPDAGPLVLSEGGVGTKALKVA